MSRPGDSSESPTALALDPHPHSDGEKWREDVAALLAFVDEGDQVECVAFANGLKIYKRLAVCVYVQLRCGKVDLKSLTSLAEPLASWSSWDDITSLCKHDVIRAKLWELVQTNDAHNEPSASFGNFKPMIFLDEEDIALKVVNILRDQGEKQRFKALCLEDPPPVLNLLQMLLDGDFGASGSKTLLVQALARFAKISGTYPDSLALEDIELTGTHPEAGGGFADIWKGKLGNQFVALKAFRIFFNDTRRIKGRLLKDFSHEAVVWRQLRHRNILPFYGVFKGDDTFDRLCLVSPWMEAGNIVDFVNSHRDCNRILLLSDVVEGLLYLHSFEPPVVHGDLKGANILVTHSGTACLGDFGLTRFRDSQENISQSTTGNANGTSRWMAPELLVSDVSGRNIHVNRGSDMYSFGCVCLEVFTGKVPFSEIVREAVVVMTIVQRKIPERPRNDCVQHGLDDAMWEMITRCWNGEPEQRSTIFEVREFFRIRNETRAGQRATIHDFPGLPRPSLSQYGFPEEYVSRTFQIAQQMKDELERTISARQFIDVEIDGAESSTIVTADSQITAMDTKQAIGSTVKNQPTGLDGEEIPAPETERLAFDRELARQTAQLTVPLSSVGSLQNSLPAIQAIPMDSNLSPVVKWCKDVLALVNRISASNVPPKDDSRTMSLDPFTGPVKISDHALSRLVDVAVTSILRISSIAESGTISVSPVAVAEAFFLRATLEASGAFPQLINHDPRKSFRDFENAVLSGYHEAWFNLGRAYEAVEDIERAKDCFQNGTNFDVESCLYRMGMAHLLGQLGLPSSSTVAIPLLHRAALLATVDVPQPAYVYGLLLRKEFSQIEVPISAFAPLIPPTSTPTLEARKHIERAAFLNFAPAQYKLGHAYQFAEPPFPFEPMLSVHYYSLASQQGKSEADMALSNWLLCGAEGCFEKDEALAYTFAEKAARKGMASAEYAIGYYHESGVGCVKDVTTAMVWYRKSAANGNTDAGERLHALLKLSPRTLSRREREAINETAFTRKGDEENRQSLPHDKTLLEYSTPWSQAVVTNTSAAHIEQRTRFSPSSPSGNLDLRGSQNRHFHAEHDPAAAPRSSAPPLKGGPSQQSFPVYIERQEVIRKKGGIFRFLPSLKPQEVSQLHGSVSGEEDGPSSAPAASTEPPSRPNGVTQLALTIQQPIVIPPTPTSAQSNPLSFFKLFSKRNRRVSIASLEACDGDAGGNGGGSTRSSISSSSFGSNGRPLPPFRDPNEAMRAWISDVESTVYHRNGRRRRPGVTFDVAYDEIPTKERRQTRDWRTVN